MTRCLLALLVALHAACAIDLSPLEQITVQEGGRKKPFLVFAEQSLLGLSGKTALTIEGRKMSAMEVVTTLWLNPLGWDDKSLLLVNHKPLKEACGLDDFPEAVFLPGARFQQRTGEPSQRSASLASAPRQSKADRVAKGSCRSRVAYRGV